TNDTLSDTVGKLLTKKWVIKKTTESAPFITSDNPGFVYMEKERRLMNLYFMGNFEFNFPLTSTRTLVINSHFNDETASTKALLTEPANEGYIKATNYATIMNAYQYLYSNSQEALIYTLTKFKEAYPWFKHK
ncbi:hypothetical protein VF13_38765, partial [Nostoc linckia z16]